MLNALRVATWVIEMARRGAEIKKLVKNNVEQARKVGLEFVTIDESEAECQIAAVTAQHSLTKLTHSLTTSSGLVVPKSALLVYNNLIDDHVWIVINSNDFVPVLGELKHYLVKTRITLDDLDFQALVSLLCDFGFEFEIWGIDTFNQMFKGKRSPEYYSMEKNFGQPLPQDNGDDDEEDDSKRDCAKYC